MPITEQSLTVADVAARYATTVRTVLAWIDSGELRALDVSRRRGSRRPTWRVTAAALAAFEAMRGSGPIDAPAPVRRRRGRQAEVIEFY